jgi:hypothetical protein
MKTNQPEVAELLADYFNTARSTLEEIISTTLPRESTTIITVWKLYEKHIKRDPVIEFRALGEDDVTLTLEHLNPQKSSGWN